MPVVTCELWWARPASAGSALLGLLDDAERARHGGFRAAADASRYLAAHALARIVLGRALGIAPAAVRLTATCRRCGGPHGKPRVADAPESELSLSHSGDWAVVALARGTPVGVDVERLRPLADLAALTRRVQSPAEIARGESVDPAELLRTWTRKEALLKASGDGLAEPMDALTLSPPADPPRLLDWAGERAPASAWLADLAPDGEHVGCVALLGVTSAELIQHPADALLAAAASAP